VTVEARSWGSSSAAGTCLVSSASRGAGSNVRAAPASSSFIERAEAGRSGGSRSVACWTTASIAGGTVATRDEGGGTRSERCL
jgi:hypothetical protein